MMQTVSISRVIAASRPILGYLNGSTLASTRLCKIALSVVHREGTYVGHDVYGGLLAGEADGRERHEHDVRVAAHDDVRAAAAAAGPRMHEPLQDLDLALALVFVTQIYLGYGLC